MDLGEAYHLHLGTGELSIKDRIVDVDFHPVIFFFVFLFSLNISVLASTSVSKYNYRSASSK